jgi:hypothetical protein
LRKIIVGGAAVALAVSTAVAGGAFAGGNGAQRSGLSPQAGNSQSGDQCVAGSGAGTNGFVLVNAPGKPGAARFVNGEVSLKDGAPNTTYTVWLATDSSNCLPEGALTTNGQGNGNHHLNDATLKNGTYYVVLKLGSDEAFASGPVSVN